MSLAATAICCVVDGGNNHVGIGTPSPQHALSIRHSDKADPQIHLETASYGNAYGVKILAASTNESGTVSSFSGAFTRQQPL